jgi:hypothetical protein
VTAHVLEYASPPLKRAPTAQVGETGVLVSSSLSDVYQNMVLLNYRRLFDNKKLPNI